MPFFERRRRPTQDPAVPAVEAFLEAAAARRPAAPTPPDAVPTAAHALWVCACVTADESPDWLVHDDGAGGLAWRRVPDGVPERDLVDARSSAGGHAAPAEVLRWLQGDAPDPWGSGGGHGDGDPAVLDALARLLRPE